MVFLLVILERHPWNGFGKPKWKHTILNLLIALFDNNLNCLKSVFTNFKVFWKSMKKIQLYLVHHIIFFKTGLLQNWAHHLLYTGMTNSWADIFVGVIVCFRILSHIHLFCCLFIGYHVYFKTWDAHSMFYYTEETKTNKKKYREAEIFAHFISDPHCMPRRVY